MDKEKLIKFEEEIAELFNSGKIKAPVHLYHGNEDQIIKIFKKIEKDDWVFCTWRSHYQCLLKGVPEKEIKNVGAYFLTLPSEVAMKLWTVIGNGEIKNTVALHQCEVKKQSGSAYIVELLTGKNAEEADE